MHSAAYAVVRCLSIRPSVCPSRSCVVSKRVNIFSNFSPYDRPTILVFFCTKRYGIIRTWLPNGGVECGRGVKKSRFSTNISLYLGNYTRYGHETPIGTHIRSIEGCHFQWPWVTLTQNSRARHYSTLNISDTVQDRDSYNGILIRTYTRHTQRYNFEWPSVILSDMSAGQYYNIILQWSVQQVCI